MFGIKPRRLLAFALVASVVALPCSAVDAEADSATVADSLQNGGELDGEPIRLGLISSPSWISYLPQGAEAAIARINATGGINGRPLELVVCDDQRTPTGGAQCAQEFAGDELLVATVGDVTSFGGDSNPVLESAEIAGVGTSIMGAGDFAAARIFGMNPGAMALLGMASFLYDDLGARNIGMAVIQDPVAEALPGLIDAAILGPRDSQLGGTVTISISAADVSPQAAALVDSDGHMLALSEDLVLRYIQASRQQGSTAPIVVAESTTAAETLQENLSPTDLEQVYGISYFNKTSQGYTDYLADMEEFQPDITPSDLSANAWLSVMVFADLAKGLDEVTRANVMAGMAELAGYDTGGMTPPLDFTVAGEALGGAAPRLVPSAQAVFVDRYEDGVWVPYADEQEAIFIFD